MTAWLECNAGRAGKLFSVIELIAVLGRSTSSEDFHESTWGGIGKTSLLLDCCELIFCLFRCSSQLLGAILLHICNPSLAEQRKFLGVANSMRVLLYYVEIQLSRGI
jgi:hypothetical protein